MVNQLGGTIMSNCDLISDGSNEEWWRAVCVMSEFMACCYEEDDEVYEGFVNVSLREQGFSNESIEKAREWISQAALSGNLDGVFSMLQPEVDALRVVSPIEEIHISKKLWRQLNNLRSKALISSDVMERLLEGIRCLDTRDWDDGEIEEFMVNVISTTYQHSSREMILDVIRGESKSVLYC
jgi:uncharacterized protein Smg (DUF494 family)